MANIDYLKLLTPDIALFWKTLWSGFSVSGLYTLILALGWILVVLGFALTVMEMVQGSAVKIGAKFLRIFFAAALLTVAPELAGFQPPPPGGSQSADNALAWKWYHGLYSAVYGGLGDQNNQGQPRNISFYARWLGGYDPATGRRDPKAPIPFAVNRMTEATKRAMLLSVELEGITLVIFSIAKSIPGVNLVCSGEGSDKGDGANQGNKLAERDLGRFKSAAKLIPFVGSMLANFFEGLCRIGQRLEKSVEEFKDKVHSAISNFTQAILILVGTHAFIIYAVTTIYALIVLFLPLLAGLSVFQRTEALLPASIGLLFGGLVNLVVSAIGFGAAMLIVFNTTAARWENALPKNDEMVELQKQARAIGQNVGRSIQQIKEYIMVDALVADEINLLEDTAVRNPGRVILGGGPVQSEDAPFVPSYEGRHLWTKPMNIGVGRLRQREIPDFADRLNRNQEYAFYPIIELEVQQDGTLRVKSKLYPNPNVLNSLNLIPTPTSLALGRTEVTLNWLRAVYGRYESAAREKAQLIETLQNKVVMGTDSLIDRMIQHTTRWAFQMKILLAGAIVMSLVMAAVMLMLSTFLLNIFSGIRVGVGTQLPGGQPPNY